MKKPSVKQLTTIFTKSIEGLRQAIKESEDDFIRQRALGNVHEAEDCQDKIEHLKICLEVAIELNQSAFDSLADEFFGRFKKRFEPK